MINCLTVKKISLLISVLFFAAASHAGEVLSRIENFKAPEYPASEHADKETYDYRVSHNALVPKTLEDTFVCDVLTLIEFSIDKPVHSYRRVPNALINKAVDQYNRRNWDELPGYRPWTHWNFVRSLSKHDVNILKNEIPRLLKSKNIDCIDEYKKQKIPVTLEMFYGLTEGMSYYQVEEILGPPHELLSSSDIENIHTTMFRWDGVGVGNMNAIFQNGVLVSRAQYGLH